MYFQRALQALPYDYNNAEELQGDINKLTISIQRLKARISGVEMPPVEEVSKAKMD